MSRDRESDEATPPPSRSLANKEWKYSFIDSSAAAVNVNASTFTFGLLQTLVDNVSTGNIPQNGVDGFGNFNLIINNTDGWADRVNTISFTVTNTSGTPGLVRLTSWRLTAILRMGGPLMRLLT